MLMLAVTALIGALAIPAAPAAAWILVSPVRQEWFSDVALRQLTGATIATHSTRGVVKEISATSLVITRSARRGKEMTFVLDPATRQEGQVVVGMVVEVRYRTEATRRVAAVVSAQEVKRQ